MQCLSELDDASQLIVCPKVELIL